MSKQKWQPFIFIHVSLRYRKGIENSNGELTNDHVNAFHLYGKNSKIPRGLRGKEAEFYD